MRTNGIAGHTNFIYGHSAQSSQVNSALISRKRAAADNAAANRSRLAKSLDKKTSTVSVHDIENSGLSAEEIHKKKLSLIQSQNTFRSTMADKADGFLKLSQAKPKTKDSMVKKHLDYSYKDISSMIRQAKTSGSAGVAAVKAKRKVLELRRKFASSTDNDEKAEISAALNHAKSMERVAKKKKHHLETEEMIEHTMKDEWREEKLTGKESPEASGSAGSAALDQIVSDAEAVVDEAYDKIDRQELEALAAAYEGYYDDAPAMEDFSLEEISSDISELTGEFDEAYDMMDEVMEDLELLEVIDPHMDEDSYKKLKTKHRSSEEKDMTKADMDYLKAMFDKYRQDMLKAAAPSGTAIGTAPAMADMGFSPGADAASVAGLPTIDISI